MKNTLTLTQTTSLEKTQNTDGKTSVVNSIATITDAIKNAEITKGKMDYSIAVLVNTLANVADDVYKSLDLHYTDSKGADVLVNNFSKYCFVKFGYSQSHCSKLKRVADKFITIDDNDLLKLEYRRNASDSTQLVSLSNDDSDYSIVADYSKVHGLCDRFGFEFSITQLQELLTYSVEQIQTAIENGDIDSSTNSSSGANNIRDTMKTLFPPAMPNNAKNAEIASTDGNTDGNTDGDTYTVENNDKSRLTAVQSILSDVKDTKILENKFFKDFVSYINVAISKM